MQDRVKIVHDNFIRRVESGDLPETPLDDLESTGLSGHDLVEIFETQVLSRLLDQHSRVLQKRGESFYTIGSSGHEGNASISAALRLEDMAFLHYRDAAFLIQRSKKLPGQTPLWDMLLSFTASSEDPISAGRHKVLGSKALNIPPQTSTIASHLPKAVGAAYSLGLAHKLGHSGQIAKDAIIYCSFGDASVNHSTAAGAINSACWAAYKGADVPILFVCEDNEIGISTPTPKNWVRNTYRERAGLKYFHCDGLNAVEAYAIAKEAANFVRTHKKPAFLHMSCIRLFGHAGPDVQTSYMSQAKVDATEAQDPLLRTAALLTGYGILNPTQILEIYHETLARIERAAEQVIKRPKLRTAQEVMSSIVPEKADVKPLPVVSQGEREESFGRETANMDQPQHMARLINWALHDLMLACPEIILAGEDIGPKGGVYGVTTKLHDRFGPHRVINTLLDEQSILGLSIGLAHNGFIPIPEIQFLAYLHNAEDQLRGEASTLSFFSCGQYTNPMVIRIAGLPYQRGFGGHFHNDNAIAVLRDIPGIVVACPSNGADAVGMLRECVRLAREEQRIVVFLEPIALYMMRDLHEEKDGLWTFPYTAPAEADPYPFGEPFVHGAGTDLCILTYGNGYYLSRQAANILKDKHTIKSRVVDLRWLVPLNAEAITEAAKPCTHVLIVDECRRSGSPSEEIMTILMENLDPLPRVKRLTAEDCFIPLGRAFASTLPRKDTILEAALNLCGKEAQS
ncbi:MAG: MFS transporter [Alphaproteobacteria bacterium]|nr:MFS transporter [Alphaproteobacteria bacterium]MCB9975919.1 MFS transporter [Rhodospirillales bacterium]